MRLLTCAFVTAGLAGEADAFTHISGKANQVRARSARQHRHAPLRRMQMQNMGYPPLPDPFPPKREGSVPLQPGEITVRFIGTEDGEDKLVAAKSGETVTTVAARAGIKIATSCRSGLCGTCTTDMEDPNWPLNKTYRPGFQTIRACVASVSVPPGCEEMVLDVYRGSAAGRKLNKNLIPHDLEDGLKLAATDLPDAMSRFGENWENDFKPDYKLKQARKAALGMGGASQLPLSEDNGVRSGGSSKVRRQVLDSLISEPRKSRRFQPDETLLSPRARALQEALQPPPPPPPPPAAAAARQPPTDSELGLRARRQRAAASDDGDAARNVGVSALRTSAYHQAAAPRPQLRHPQEGSGANAGAASAAEAAEAAAAAAAAAGSEGWNENADVFARDYSGPVRRVLQQQAAEAHAAAEARALSQAAWEAAVERDNYLPDFSRQQRAVKHTGVNEMPRAAPVGGPEEQASALDVLTGRALPHDTRVGSAVRQAPSQMGVKQACTACGGPGLVVCYQCEGAGELVDRDVMAGVVVTRQCYLCMGSGRIRCSNCQGTGVR